MNDNKQNQFVTPRNNTLDLSREQIINAFSIQCLILELIHQKYYSRLFQCSKTSSPKCNKKEQKPYMIMASSTIHSQPPLQKEPSNLSTVPINNTCYTKPL